MLVLTVSLVPIREFVEKVMKDVDPSGFVERRPKWKPVTIVGLPDAAGQAPLPVPSASSTSPQHHAHVAAPLPVSIDMPHRIEAQPVSQSLHYSNAHPVSNAPPPGLFQSEWFTVGNLSLLTCVPHDVGRGGIDDVVREDWNMDSNSAPLLNYGVPGTAGSIVADRHVQDEAVTNQSASLNALQEDAPRFDDRGDVQAPNPQSGTTGTCMASETLTVVLVPTQSSPQTNTASPDASRGTRELLGYSFRLRVLTCVVDSATDGTTRSSSGGGPDPHLWETISLKLKNTLKDLWSQLDDWCAAPLGHTDTEPPRPDQFPNSQARGTSIDTFPHGPRQATQTRCVFKFNLLSGHLPAR